MKRPKPSRKNSSWEYRVTAYYRGITTEELESRIGRETDGNGFLFVDGTHDAEWLFKTRPAAMRAFNILNRCRKVTTLGLEKSQV